MYDVEENKKFKKGDKVRIVRAASDDEGGWDNSWVKTMSDFIGKEGIVERDSNSRGVRVFTMLGKLKASYCYPHFVLEHVNNMEAKYHEPCDDYPHTCDYCQSPAWNGMNFKCSNEKCVTNNG